MTRYEGHVPQIQSGEPATPAVANRAPDVLASSVAYLKARMDAAAFGSAHFHWDAPLAPTTKVGSLVYWDVGARRYAPGKEGLEQDPSYGVLRLTPAAKVVGLVVEKSTETLGRVLLSGFVSGLSFDAVTDDETLGDYGVSNVVAGEPVPVATPGQRVLFQRLALDSVLFYPPLRGFETAHVHAKFDLTCEPAGDVTPPGIGDPHVIADPNANLAGWLPASHESFDGLAPTGAKFGYNLAAHPAVAEAFPPSMIGSAQLVFDRGDSPETMGQVVPPSLAVVDANGIWWMSDCYDDVPWPVDFGATVSSSASASTSCPRVLAMRLTLHLGVFVADTWPTLVLGLVSTDDRIKIYCEGTTRVASVGRLAIGLDLTQAQKDVARQGSVVFKQLVGSDFETGRVLEGIYTEDPKVQIASSNSRPLTEDEGAPTLHQGTVSIAVADAAQVTIPPQLVDLYRVTEESSPVPYYEFPNSDQQSRLTSAFVVPTTLSGTLTFRYRVWLIGRSAGTLPQLEVEYLKLSRPPADLAPEDVTLTFSDLTIDTTGTLVSSDQYVEAESDPISVQAGDMIYVRMTRIPTSPGDTYAAAMGAVQQAGVVFSS